MDEKALPDAKNLTSEEGDARKEDGHEPSFSEVAPTLPRRVTLFADVDWASLGSVKSNPIEFLRRRGVRLYVRIDTEKFVVFAYRSLHGHLQGLIGMGFRPDIAYLALDNKALSEVAVSGLTNRSEFTAGGLSVIEGDYSGPPTLDDAFFKRCYVLKKAGKMVLESPTAPPETRPDYKESAVDLLLREEDLWLEESDLARIREADLLSGDLVKYPYDHRLQVPAVYEMFQAAYALNSLKSLGTDEEVVRRLRKKDSKLFSVRRAELATKFIAPLLDRSRGRAGQHGAKPFKVGDLGGWADDTKTFIFPYVSDGLTIILAVTDWWVHLLNSNPGEHVSALADKLHEQNFDDAEVGHLVRLITGTSLRKVCSKDVREQRG